MEQAKNGEKYATIAAIFYIACIPDDLSCFLSTGYLSIFEIPFAIFCAIALFIKKKPVVITASVFSALLTLLEQPVRFFAYVVLIVILVLSKNGNPLVSAIHSFMMNCVCGEFVILS